MKNVGQLLRTELLLCILATSHIAIAAVTVVPAQPKTLEAVTVAVDIPNGYVPVARPNISMAANKITIIGQMQRAGFAGPGVPPPSSVTTFGLGQLPAGQYSVEFKLASDSAEVSTANFAVSDAPATRVAEYPGYNFSDIWWNPAESGWGISIHVKNDNLFAAWFVYDLLGRPQWYTFQAGSWSAIAGSPATLTPITYVYTGKVVKTSGPNFGGIDTLQSTIGIAEAGTATIRFTDYNAATFVGTVEGRAFAKTLVRQVF